MTPKISLPLSLSLFLVFSIANILVDVLFVTETQRVALTREPPLSRYTFIEDDYPPYLPVPSARTAVALSLEESVRFGLAQPETTLEWAYTGAVGDSNIRLGPVHRFFNTGFAYQLHCARFIVGAFTRDPPTTRGDRAHVSRCLNVLRQFSLCAADTTLEPADAMARNLTAVRVGGERQCRDWPALYDMMEENWAEWRAYQQTLAA